jgi:hypothetical protein
MLSLVSPRNSHARWDARVKCGGLTTAVRLAESPQALIEAASLGFTVDNSNVVSAGLAASQLVDSCTTLTRRGRHAEYM